jgi:hypothetical protein
MGKFIKGQSGNPGGKVKTREVRLLAREYTVEAINTLVELMRYKKAPTIRVRAAEVLLDRGWGRPMQAMEVALEDSRQPQETPALTPPEVLAAVGALLDKAERELGLSPDSGLTEDQRVERMLQKGVAIPPDLYEAVMQLQETRH